MRIGRTLLFVGLALTTSMVYGSTFAFWESGVDNRRALLDYFSQVVLPLFLAGAVSAAVGQIMVAAQGTSRNHVPRRALILTGGLLSLMTAILAVTLPLDVDYSGRAFLGILYMGALACYAAIWALHPPKAIGR